jgi:hypothetical protein
MPSISRVAWRLHSRLQMHAVRAGGTRYVVTRQQWSFLDPDDADAVEHLVVDVRPAHRHARWAWCLVDGRDGSELETGFDYDSPSDARRAAIGRLEELTSALLAAPAVVRPTAFESRSLTLLHRKSA